MKTGFLILLASSSLGAGLLVSAPQSRESKPIEGNLLNVGHTFTGLKGVALDGKEVTVPVAGAKGTVIAFSSVTCPLCQKLEPTLASLEDSYSDRGVKFVFLNPSTIESAGEMKQLVQRLKLDGPYVHDPKGTWTKALTAKTTTETFLLDPSGKLIYRGAIDDQYAIGAALPAPKNRYLANAIDAMLAGKPVPVAVTEAPGCLLNTEPLPMEDATPTYHGQRAMKR
jgi:thiol-disulfide isomerase/thioredoxin